MKDFKSYRLSKPVAADNQPVDFFESFADVVTFIAVGVTVACWARLLYAVLTGM